MWFFFFLVRFLETWQVADFLEQLSDPMDAITAYAGALALDPNLTGARVKAASLLASQARCEEAIRLVNQSPVQNSQLDEIVKRCAKK
jgi:hypothetical protein